MFESVIILDFLLNLLYAIQKVCVSQGFAWQSLLRCNFNKIVLFSIFCFDINKTEYNLSLNCNLFAKLDTATIHEVVMVFCIKNIFFL